MTQPCPSCGTPNEDAYRFCANCGTPLKADTQPVQQPPSPPAADAGTLYSIPQAGSSPSPLMPGPTLSGAQPAPTSYVVKKADADYMADVTPTTPYTPAPPPPPQSQGYQGYAPSASAPGNREGATFAPYTSGAASALEKPKEQRSWLMPVIAVAAVVLLGLVALSGYLALNNRGEATLPATSPTSPSSGGTTDLPTDASEEDKIRAVIVQSNENQIRAWKELDEELLKENYTGKALAENLAMVRQLKKDALYAEPVNQRLDILDVSVDGDKATVRTIEVWTVSFYTMSDKKLVEKRDPQTLSETYYLVKQDGVWLIENLVIDEQQ